jgi:hypothetical protein
VRGILIGLADMVAEMNCLEQVCIIFLDGFPTLKCFCCQASQEENRVLREESGGGGIVVDVCVVSFFKERIKLLA